MDVVEYGDARKDAWPSGFETLTYMMWHSQV